jgi:mannan endo-1,4-beta-mannosidase
MRRFLAAALALSVLTPETATAAPAEAPLPIATQPGNGWIRVAPNGRYLQHENGAPFFVVGHDEAFGFFYQKMNPKPVLEAFLKHMKANGQNTLLVQVDTEDRNFYGGHRLNLEWPAGVYHEDIARQFDELMDMAEANGIYVITYLWDTFHMTHKWGESPYNAKHGGPCTYPSEMFTNERAIALQKKKLAWAIDRWGARKNLLAWDLMNEADTISGAIDANKDAQGKHHTASSDEIREWYIQMARFCREYELKKWGKSHLRTISTTNPRYERFWFYETPEIDIVTNHQYYWNLTADPTDSLDPIIGIREGLKQVLPLTRYLKPYMDTESGPIGWDLRNHQKALPFDTEYFHNSIWTNWASGAAGSSLRWPYPNYGFGGKPFLNPLNPEQTKSLAVMAEVSRYVDWNDFTSHIADTEFTTDDKGIWTMGCSDDNQILGFIVKNHRETQAATVRPRVRFSGLKPGAYEVLWFDDRTGAIQKRDVAEGMAFELRSPKFDKSGAVVVRPLGEKIALLDQIKLALKAELDGDEIPGMRASGRWQVLSVKPDRRENEWVGFRAELESLIDGRRESYYGSFNTKKRRLSKG